MTNGRKPARFAALAFGAAAVGMVSANASALSWSGWRSIQEVTQENGSVVFVLDGAKVVAASACQNKFRIDSNDPDASAKTASLNSAYSSAKRIDVSFIPETTACSVLVFDLAVEP